MASAEAGAYNAEMGQSNGTAIDAWLRGGGTVVTASERGARAVAQAFHRARQAEGLSAWLAPDVVDWQQFVSNEWSKRRAGARMVLNALQEQALWAGIIAHSDAGLANLEGPRQRLAAMASEAHRLLCLYAPQFLNPGMRGAWPQDSGVFSGWLAEFDAECRRNECVSAARLALELENRLKQDKAGRPELLLAGFDRILPAQADLLAAWGSWNRVENAAPSSNVLFLEAGDPGAELAACALWCRQTLRADPSAKLLVVTQNVTGQRGEIERALLRYAQPEDEGRAGEPLFEFSLGVPVAHTAPGRGALLTLQWLTGTIREDELDWLLSTGLLAANDEEMRALQAHMRKLRQRNLQRTEWKLESWITANGSLPTAWTERMTQASRDLQREIRRPQIPLKWAELAQKLLGAAGWPGGRPLESEEFQVTRRLELLLDECASMGFDGKRIEWREFVDTLMRTAEQTLFSPESEDAPILIAGPAESAGLEADGIWFLGASEDAWPATGATHPFLPVGVQREAQMPHAAPQFDWELAQGVTERLLSSSQQVNFSYARHVDDVEARPSRVIAKVAGAPRNLPAELRPPRTAETQTEEWTDESRVPFPGGKVRGGARVLTAQSQCPFKAFATARLAAQGWEPAEAGLTAAQRGRLLHAALKLVWDVSQGGVGSHAELSAIPDLRSFVAARAQRAMSEELRSGEREAIPSRYLELEQVRLANLVTEWLEYEKARVPFTVEGTEVVRTIEIEGLDLHVRIDRLDRLSDGKLLVIDYKSGAVDPKDWDLPRPNDVQLPLYAGFALKPQTEEPTGLLFAKVRAGEPEFAGCIENARTTLRAKASANSNLVKKPLTPERLDDWKEYIRECARAFMLGHAEVDPRDYPGTCDDCALRAMCRIEEIEELTSQTGGAGNGDE